MALKKFLIFTFLVLLFIPAGFAQTLTRPVTFTENGLIGLKDERGNIIVKPQYKKLIQLNGNAWIVQKKNKFGMIDNEGNVLVKIKYRHTDRYFGKFAKFGNENDYGLYDHTGKAIIPPEFSSIDPLFHEMFLTCKNFKYGIVDFEGRQLLKNEYDDIYMPRPSAMRIRYEGEWYEIERLQKGEINLPSNVKKMTINNKDFKITKLLADTGVVSGYSIVSATDYTMKIFSSISPAYEQTIDELMLSQGAEVVSIFMKLSWIPQFPVTYIKKYYTNLRTPNNGPLSEIKYDLKKQLND